MHQDKFTTAGRVGQSEKDRAFEISDLRFEIPCAFYMSSVPCGGEFQLLKELKFTKNRRMPHPLAVGMNQSLSNWVSKGAERPLVKGGVNAPPAKTRRAARL